MKARAGYTLLEVLIASTIMAVAVGTLMTALSTSVRNAARSTEADRAAILARRTMDNLLLDPFLMPGAELQGNWNQGMEGMQGGWRARVELFEKPENPQTAGELDRVIVEAWWMNGSTRKTLTIEAYRRVQKRPERK